MKRGARLLFRQCRRQQQQQQQPVSPVGATRRACSGSLALSHQMDSSPSESSLVRYCYNPTLHWNQQVEEYFIKAYGSDHFARISRALTRPSSYSCIRVNTPKTSVDSVIEKLTSILHERNPRSSANSMCIGKSNGSAKGDHDLKLSTNEDELLDDLTCLLVQKCKIPGLEYVLFVKGSGPHLLQYGDTSGLKEVIVSRKCAEAVLRGAQAFVPGVLACSSHVEKGDLVAVSVAVEQPGPDGEWGVHITRGTVLQGLQSDPHYHERKGLYIGQGMAMMSRAGIFRALQGVAVEMTSRIYNLPSFHDVLEGEIFLQNLPSIIAAHALDPLEGERILDMCAAPGGKTTAIAALMRDKGEVIALDRSHNKVMDILKLAEEMGLSCISAYKLDALRAVRKKGDPDVDFRNLNNGSTSVTLRNSGFSGNGMPIYTKECNTDMNVKKCGEGCMHSPEEKQIPDQNSSGKAGRRKDTQRMRNGPGKNNLGGGRVVCSNGFLPDSFDRVLLDAPCSALGLRPRLFTGEETIESLKNHANYQRRMFDQAVQLVRPGGVIVYSTCTINPGENEALVRYALDKYKFLSLASQNPRIGGPGLVGCCELLNGKYSEEWLTESEAELVQRFDPSSSLDTIGFFIAKFNVGSKDV